MIESEAQTMKPRKMIKNIRNSLILGWSLWFWRILSRLINQSIWFVLHRVYVSEKNIFYSVYFILLLEVSWFLFRKLIKHLIVSGIICKQPNRHVKSYYNLSSPLKLCPGSFSVIMRLYNWEPLLTNEFIWIVPIKKRPLCIWRISLTCTCFKRGFSNNSEMALPNYLKLSTNCIVLIY